ncbi:hypothetical protein Y032_0221g2588 [Ancylostoma ceylanicum]|uniref:Uncharacterized protein n=1 Tax=Ancylostoma ceylanicum TaxID=53326 RepID=A0A016SIB5_9BILA|nr:hypothetical protein Y032_0221g2588 [Ancylostoma ceylanicum]
MLNNGWSFQLFFYSSISTKADDSSDSEAEQSESGQPSAGHSTTFVRPRKAKKGPFDFEHLRMVQICNWNYMRNRREYENREILFM